MIEAQGGKCATCERPIPPAGRTRHVDHNHTTGRIRGILCQPCNVALGHLQENPDTLRRMIAYLEADAVAGPGGPSVNDWLRARDERRRINPKA